MDWGWDFGEFVRVPVHSSCVLDLTHFFNRAAPVAQSIHVHVCRVNGLDRTVTFHLGYKAGTQEEYHGHVISEIVEEIKDEGECHRHVVSEVIVELKDNQPTLASSASPFRIAAAVRGKPTLSDVGRANEIASTLLG